MDPKDSKNRVSAPPRRSTRKIARALSVEPTPRGPIKRAKQTAENRHSAAPKSSKDVENGLEDEESPSKKPRVDSEAADGDKVNEEDMEFQESAVEKEAQENQEMEPVEEPSYEPISKGATGDTNFYPHVKLHKLPQGLPARHLEPEKLHKERKLHQKALSPTKSEEQMKGRAMVYDVSKRSMGDYRVAMEAKARSANAEMTAGKARGNQMVQRVVPHVQKVAERKAVRETFRDPPAQNKVPLQKKQEGAKGTAGAKSSCEGSCRGFSWFCWCLAFLVLLSSTTLLAIRSFPAEDEGTPQSAAATAGKFWDVFSLLRERFPNQQSELWVKTSIHLRRHLEKAEPSEPVSLILTAGAKAEKTLECLARAVAAAFSAAASNDSALFLDGAGKAGGASDEVKLDIDTQLRAAFEGGRPAAVIHRFEELPPGSTLIFYRYCDHENAAFKRALLLFTVLLPQEELPPQLSLKEVEEKVHDHVEEKLVSSTQVGGFNEMDNDKFSGLWSRISHVVLPVMSEEGAERGECPSDAAAQT